MKAKPQTHVYARGEYLDHRGVPYCTCGAAKGASVHRVPEQDEEVSEYERRKVGER